MATEQCTDEDPPDRATIARSLAAAGIGDVHVVDRQTAAALLTEKRQELSEPVRRGDAESIRDLARRLDRDAAAVSRDLNLLVRHDVIEYESAGQRKVPRLRHTCVVAEPIA